MTVRSGFECDLCKRREWHDLPKGLPDGWRTEGVCLHICPECITLHGRLLHRIVHAAHAAQGVGDLTAHTLTQFVSMAYQWKEQQEAEAKKIEERVAEND